MYANPRHLEAFTNHMTSYTIGKTSWLDPGCYPLEERLGGAKSDVLLVDVGGGLGDDLEELRAKCPALAERRLVLQELPEVVRKVPPEKRHAFEPMAHDFFKPQPVAGAAAYYMHSCLHDWDDAAVVRILRQFVPAMRRGVSRVLVHENVVPETGAPWDITSLDWLLFVLLGSGERTEAEWKRLAQEVGLQVVKVWNFDKRCQSIVEMELA